MLGFRRETCPTYESKMDEDKPTQVYTVIGGRIDPADDSPHEAAFRELREEAGIIVMNHTIRCEVLNLPICKSSNVRINAYVADILEWTSEVPVGDGTIWEDMSSTEWRGESAMSSVFNDVHIPHDMMLQYLYGLYLLHPQK